MVLSRGAEGLDLAVEIAAVNQVEDLHAVGMQPEKQTMLAADSLAQDAVTGLELHDAGKRGGLPAGEAPDRGQCRARRVAREEAGSGIESLACVVEEKAF